MRKAIIKKLKRYPRVREFLPYYRRYKEFISYSLVGILTFLVCVVSYSYFNLVVGMDELIANIFSWIFTVSFAFFSNKAWVFHSRSRSIGQFFGQMFSFFSGRACTLFLEEIILLVFVKEMGMGSVPVKVTAQIVVISVNYMVSKLLVFRKQAV